MTPDEIYAIRYLFKEEMPKNGKIRKEWIYANMMDNKKIIRNMCLVKSGVGKFAYTQF